MIRLVTKVVQIELQTKGVLEKNEVKKDVGIIIFNGFNASHSRV